MMVEPRRIVTDIRMPGMDGIELIRRLRAQNCNFRIIAMTGHADVPLAIEATKADAMEFLEKPFDDDLLLSSIMAALSDGENRVATDVERIDIQQRRPRAGG
jgi:two-component system response regulator FixJ